MTLKTNECACGGKCGCNSHTPLGPLNGRPGVFASNRIKVQVEKNSRHETFEGRDHLVVPVIMLRSDVVMNETLTPVEEIYPPSWNGVPVTLGHPETGRGNVPANSPEIIEKWGVGTIFNSRLDGEMLKAEAWIDVAKAENLKPGLVAELEDKDSEIDVSTGFFSMDEDKSGTLNGRDFVRVARAINPDHLALLPGAIGACSWEDGCGIRANRKGAPMSTEDPEVKVSTVAAVMKMLGINVAPKTNERGDDDDYRQMIADLISNDSSPFLPEDEDSLRMMSYATLTKMRDAYVPGGKKDENNNSAAAGDDDQPDKEAMVANEDKGANAPTPMTADQITALVTNAVNAAVGPAVADALKAHQPQLSDEDRLALNSAKKTADEYRAGLVKRIVANSAMTEEQVKDWPLPQVELVANGLLPQANYGRPVNFTAAEKDDPEVAAMVPPTVKTNRKELN